MITRDKYNSLLKEHSHLKMTHQELRKEFRSLVNYILRIRKRCESEKLYLIASYDPYKPLIPEHQQGPLITRLYEMTEQMKKRLK